MSVQSKFDNAVLIFMPMFVSFKTLPLQIGDQPMIYKYKMGLLQQLRLLFPMTAKVLAVAVLMIVANYSLSWPIFLVLFVFFFLIDILPTLIVHVQYFFRDRATVISVNMFEKSICFYNRDKSYIHFFADVISVNYYTSFLHSSGRHSFGEYRYYKITFKDKSEFIVTSVLINDIENNIGKLFPVKAETYQRLIALIY
jgi:hypothetical protein